MDKGILNLVIAKDISLKKEVKIENITIDFVIKYYYYLWKIKYLLII